MPPPARRGKVYATAAGSLVFDRRRGHARLCRTGSGAFTEDVDMMIDGLGFLGGFLTGAAGSLHCFGICGGIASSLFLATGPGTGSWAPAANALALQLGRVTTYALLGALAGSGGGAVTLLLDFSGAQQILRLLAAATLVMAGLSVVGIVPDMSQRIVAALFTKPACCASASGSAASVPLLLGMAWGMAPCGMVYSALLTAAFSGSPVNGAVFMLGFGSATIPALALALYGSARATSRIRSASARFRTPLGWSLTALGLLSMLAPAATIGALCLGIR